MCRRSPADGRRERYLFSVLATRLPDSDGRVVLARKDGLEGIREDARDSWCESGIKLRAIPEHDATSNAIAVVQRDIDGGANRSLRQRSREDQVNRRIGITGRRTEARHTARPTQLVTRDHALTLGIPSDECNKRLGLFRQTLLVLHQDDQSRADRSDHSRVRRPWRSTELSGRELLGGRYGTR